MSSPDRVVTVRKGTLADNDRMSAEFWAEVRQSPQFPQVMKELGWWKHYELANATKAKERK